MFFGKSDKKKSHPYAWLAIFSLAAAGLISIGKKSRDFITDKAKCVTDMVKSKSQDM
ncbi:MAG: hypothetical protein IJX92_02035 [Clostridia bacterium]|nr:hypothetical protein [Clostridia bacterium]